MNLLFIFMSGMINANFMAIISIDALVSKQRFY